MDTVAGHTGPAGGTGLLGQALGIDPETGSYLRAGAAVGLGLDKEAAGRAGSRLEPEDRTSPAVRTAVLVGEMRSHLLAGTVTAVEEAAGHIGELEGGSRHRSSLAAAGILPVGDTGCCWDSRS